MLHKEKGPSIAKLLYGIVVDKDFPSKIVIAEGLLRVRFLLLMRHDV
jgi:hypothetical protein